MKKIEWKLLTSIPYVGLLQAEYFFHLNQYLIILILMFPLLFTRRRDYKLDKSTGYSLLLSVIFIFMLIEPAIAYGKAHFNIVQTGLLGNFLYTLLFSVSLIFQKGEFR